MNGRLAALAEQAGYFIKFERTGKDVTVVHTKEPGTDGDLALFAELIIRECMNVMSKTSEEANKRFTYMGDDVPTVVHQMRIEEHFGVKE
jgi:hypothetical protein